VLDWQKRRVKQAKDIKNNTLIFSGTTTVNVLFSIAFTLYIIALPFSSASPTLGLKGIIPDD